MFFETGFDPLDDDALEYFIFEDVTKDKDDEDDLDAGIGDDDDED